MTQVVPIRNFFLTLIITIYQFKHFFAATQREKRLFSEKNIHIHQL